ncbi:hypothetical protein [Streptomyces sp. TRM68367]|uniref:hypothetical protein n=1 Tax=Streptomyces sp. TRM68367 TaxID=2758415 RepID=UPI00165AB6EE|nr:hypothetical protein [Streptomyces sp. TRM68367]MBC9730691.1 hypothetical protein [Streptomyces sp. TRM68367]
MPATDNPAETKAIRELDRLTNRYNSTEDAVDEAREKLRVCIVKHLRARSAPPGQIADHVPYDRNHVGRIGAEAVPPVTPLKGPNRDPNEPKPQYSDAVVAAALAELDEHTKEFRNAESKRDKAREALHEAIVRHYTDRNLGPGEIAQHSPYDRNHIMRLARAAGAPHVRPRAGNA